MITYKAPDNSLHAIEPLFEHLLPAGCVPITEAEADAIRAAQQASLVPAAVDMAQARLALLQSGHLATVNAAIAAMPGAEGEAARIEWEFRARVRRDSALVVAMAAVLGLSDSETDALFRLAETL